MATFSREELKQRAFLRAARMMRDLWEEKGSSDTRLLLSPLIPDEFVLAGESLQGAGHNEHVVPRVVICSLCHDLFEKGGSDAEAAALIARLLKVVRISVAEQRRIDYELGLKQVMPPDWSHETGSPFARLDHAGVQYRLYP